MCQKYLGLNRFFPTTEEADDLPVDDLMSYILEKGNFGRKAGVEGKTASFSLFSTEHGGFFKRLQVGGLGRWKAAKQYKVLRPFAWIYQGFRILGILLKNKMGIKEVLAQTEKGRKQRELIEALGLRVDRTIQINND